MSLHAFSKADLVLVGAGEGRRMGTPKAFLQVGGVPLLRLTAQRLSSFPWANAIAVVPLGKLREARLVLSGLPFEVVEGGATRARSVQRGVARCGAQWVVIHDCARPSFSPAALPLLLEDLENGAVASVLTRPVPHSLARITNGEMTDIVDREGIHEVHTPQAFLRSRLLSLLGRDVPEETRLFLDAGEVISVHHDPSPNPKLTWPGDEDRL
ncbi:2-C-methyl-D-erythritol 4-phosphate cytidylyltransferase [bacterium]|nr:2-C-methyl-D-erythritol 4-phosphate cytidylyltransferase [bacterium]